MASFNFIFLINDASEATQPERGASTRLETARRSATTSRPSKYEKNNKQSLGASGSHSYGVSPEADHEYTA